MDNKEIKKERLELIEKAINEIVEKLTYIYGLVRVNLEEEDEDECSHCGQDAEPSVSMKDLLGMEVVGVGKCRCDECPMEPYKADCRKVELVGGDYLCLTVPQDGPENDERPVISFEDEPSNPISDIREKTEAFIDYLESVVKSRTHGLG